MFNKINEDFIQSKAFYSSNCSFTAKALYSSNNLDAIFNLESLVYNMRFVYSLNKFAYAEFILNDTAQRLMDRVIYLNDGNYIDVEIRTPLDTLFRFSGRIGLFKCIDIPTNMYYMRIYSVWNYLNIYPDKVRIGLFNENGMTFSNILNNIIYYQIPIKKDKTDATKETANSKAEGNSLYLFDVDSATNPSFYCTATDNSVKLKTYIVPNWNLEETLNYIVPFCSVGNEKGGDFIWYENIDGLYVISVEEMYKRGNSKTVNKFFVNEFQHKESSENSEGTISQNVIYDYEFISGYDTKQLKENYAGGMNQVMFDNIQKKVVHSFSTGEESEIVENQYINSNISEYLANRKTIYGKPLLDNSLNSAISYNSASVEYREFSDAENNSKLAQSYANNKITKSLFNNYNLVIKTNFIPTISIGSFVYIDFPSLPNKNREPIKDYSGVWMVVGAEYVYEANSPIDSQPFYYSIFTLARDSKYSDSGTKFEKFNQIEENN